MSKVSKGFKKRKKAYKKEKALFETVECKSYELEPAFVDEDWFYYASFTKEEFIELYNKRKEELIQRKLKVYDSLIEAKYNWEESYLLTRKYDLENKLKLFVNKKRDEKDWCEWFMALEADKLSPHNNDYHKSSFKAALKRYTESTRRLVLAQVITESMAIQYKQLVIINSVVLPFVLYKFIIMPEGFWYGVMRFVLSVNSAVVAGLLMMGLWFYFEKQVHKKLTFNHKRYSDSIGTELRTKAIILLVVAYFMLLMSFVGLIQL